MAVFASTVVLVLSLAIAAFFSSVVRRSPIDPFPLYLPAHPKAEGAYAHNAILQNIEKLGKGQLSVPEDLAVDPTGKVLYVTTADGWIKKLHLSDGTVEDWKHVGGRPLGVTVGNDGEVVVCEAHQGLMKVTEESVEVLTSEADGVPLKFVNEVTIAKNGLIYFTDSSSKFSYHDYWMDVLEGTANGRLLVFNPKDKSTKVLLRNLFFPNGVVLSESEDFLVYCESVLAKCSKYFVDGEKKGTTEPFIENLPGFPDNIHRNSRETYYIALAGARDAVSDYALTLPSVKQLLGAYPALFRMLDKGGKMSRVLAVDAAGKPVQMYEDPTAKEIGFATSAIEVDGHLYIGSLKEDFVGRIKVQ